MPSTRVISRSTSNKPRSILSFLTKDEAAAAEAKTGTVDMTVSINRALASGEPIYWPGGLYTHRGRLNLPDEGAALLFGDGDTTEIRAIPAPPAVSIPTQMYKNGVDAGGSKDPVFIRDMRFNANRLADRCLRVGASKKGGLTNLQFDNFLIEGARCGDESGLSTASYYENWIQHVIADGGIAHATAAEDMPVTGLYLTTNATDNTVIDVVGSYITEAGIQSFGGFNKLYDIHSYGLDSADTGPKFNIVAAASTLIVGPAADNVTVAGVDVRFESVTIVGGSSYWAPGNTPTHATIFASCAGTTLTVASVSTGSLALGQILTADIVAAGTRIEEQLTGTAGSTGAYRISVSQTFAARDITASGAVPVQVAADVTDVTIVGHVLRGSNELNPAVRWLGSSRPGGMVAIFGGTRFTPQINDMAANMVNQSFGITRRSGYDTCLPIDAASGQVGVRELRRVNALRYQDGLLANDEWGVRRRNGASWVNAITHDYATNTWLFSDNVRQALAATNTPVNNGEMCFELASDTSLVVRVKGADGTVRSAALTLS